MAEMAFEPINIELNGTMTDKTNTNAENCLKTTKNEPSLDLSAKYNKIKAKLEDKKE